MRSTATATAPTARFILPALLIAGWLVGFAIHASRAWSTTWGDIAPDLMLLGAVLCVLAGASVRALAPARRMRSAAVAAIGVWVAILLGNVLIAVIWVLPFHAGDGGETPMSMLLESWFWIGLPTALAALLGAAGWRLAGRVGGSAPAG